MEAPILTPWSWALFERQPVMKLFKNYSASYGRFIITFPGALYSSLS
jgi:hypothetical protein